MVIGLAAYDTEAVYTKAQRAAGLADDPDLERRSNNPPGADQNEWTGGNLNPVSGNRTLNNLGSIDIAQLSGAGDSIITRVDYIIGNDSGGTGGFLFESGGTSQSIPEPSTAPSHCSPSSD